MIKTQNCFKMVTGVSSETVIKAILFEIDLDSRYQLGGDLLEMLTILNLRKRIQWIAKQYITFLEKKIREP